MAVRANAANARIVYHDSSYALPAIIKVRRSKVALRLRLEEDGKSKEVIVKARPNPAFLIGNIPWLWAAPVAYLIDFTNAKRFTYGRNLMLDIKDTDSVYRPGRVQAAAFHSYWTRPSAMTKRGDVVLNLSLPFVNNFLLQPEGEQRKENTGFLGIGIGLRYAYRANRSVSLSAGAALDYPVPFLVAIEYSGMYEQVSTSWVSICITIIFIGSHSATDLPFPAMHGISAMMAILVRRHRSVHRYRYILIRWGLHWRRLSDQSGYWKLAFLTVAHY